VPNKLHFKISPLSVSVRADGLWACAAVLIVALVLWLGLAAVCVVGGRL
jgi:hypothetical protein